MFPHLYHLSSMKNCWVANKETIDVLALTSLIGEVELSPGRRNVCFWSPNPVGGFS